MYGDLMWQTNEIAHKEIWTWLQKGNRKSETESLIIAVLNNTKGKIILNQKLIIYNKIASVDYGKEKMKCLIT